MLEQGPFLFNVKHTVAKVPLRSSLLCCFSRLTASVPYSWPWKLPVRRVGVTGAPLRVVSLRARGWAQAGPVYGVEWDGSKS